MTTARANQTTGLANGRAANWEPEVVFSPFRALSRRQLTFPSCCSINVIIRRRRGPKGEALLQMAYANVHCAARWGELLKISKQSVDHQILRALTRLFPGVNIPKPLETVYVYWEEGAV